jgi:asparagine synthase (glutamine-hydrolysing)
MCGIAGAVNFKNFPQANVAAMVELIRHRGPDAQKIFKDGPINFGHARLRIIDLDQIADQPFHSADGSVILVYNGEIYNYKELKTQLNNYIFKTQCDTEVIIAAYLNWGVSCLNYFNGMFSFVLFDKRTNSIFAARDRMGIKPFYYSWSGNEFLFASEIKSLNYALGYVEPNYEAIKEYLTFDNCDYGSNTFFTGVSQLLPGEYLLLDEKEFKLKRYYDIKFQFKPLKSLTLEDAAKISLDLIKSSISYQVQSDVPVGLYFSGGLDSNTIATILSENNSAPIKSITAISSDVPHKEIEIINKLADEFGLNQYFCDSESKEIKKLLSRIMWHMEMPYATSALCDDALNRKAKSENITVVLEGQGSDEFQAGYTKYYIPFLMDLLYEGKLNTFIKELFKSPLKFSRLKIILSIAKRIYKKLICSLNYQLIGNNIWQRYACDKLHGKNDKVLFLNNPFKSELLNTQYCDVYAKLQRVLRFKDRLSMSYGLELRVPFLDHRLIEFMLNVPNQLKIKDGEQKLIIKRALENKIANKIIKLPKNQLLKSKISADTMFELQSEAIKILTNKNSMNRGLFKVNELISDFYSKKISFSTIWRVSQVELWHQTFIDNANCQEIMSL